MINITGCNDRLTCLLYRSSARLDGQRAAERDSQGAATGKRDLLDGLLGVGLGGHVPVDVAIAS